MLAGGQAPTTLTYHFRTLTARSSRSAWTPSSYPTPTTGHQAATPRRDRLSHRHRRAIRLRTFLRLFKPSRSERDDIPYTDPPPNAAAPRGRGTRDRGSASHIGCLLKILTHPGQTNASGTASEVARSRYDADPPAPRQPGLGSGGREPPAAVRLALAGASHPSKRGWS
jgi:hypothetical protein